MVKYLGKKSPTLADVYEENQVINKKMTEDIFV